MMIDISGIAKIVTGGLDALFTSDEERYKAEQKITETLQQPHIMQALITQQEAKHPSVFVSGWRPALGWLLVILLGWAWFGRDVLIVILELTDHGTIVDKLPTVPTSVIITTLLSLCGLGGARTIEKIKQVARSR